jgi:hypothetical protein
VPLVEDAAEEIALRVLPRQVRERFSHMRRQEPHSRGDVGIEAGELRLEPRLAGGAHEDAGAGRQVGHGKLRTSHSGVERRLAALDEDEKSWCAGPARASTLSCTIGGGMESKISMEWN